MVKSCKKAAVCKKPAAAVATVKAPLEPKTTAAPFVLEHFVRAMTKALPAACGGDSKAVPGNVPQLKWGSGFDGMNTVSRAMDQLFPNHQQMFGAEICENAAAFGLRIGKPLHLFKDCLQFAAFSSS